MWGCRAIGSEIVAPPDLFNTTCCHRRFSSSDCFFKSIIPHQAPNTSETTAQKNTPIQVLGEAKGFLMPCNGSWELEEQCCNFNGWFGPCEEHSVVEPVEAEPEEKLMAEWGHACICICPNFCGFHFFGRTCDE